jgi:hypothetical protein
MPPRSLLGAALLSFGAASGSASADGSEAPYALVCTSLWTKLNNAPLTIQTASFTDTFWIDAASNTVNGVRAAFSNGEISWDSGAPTETTVSTDRTTHVANTITGKYTVLIRSFNPTQAGPDISEYAGQCVRNNPQR